MHTLKSRRAQNESLFGEDFGPFFFENMQEEAVTVNGDRYRAMLNEVLFTKQHLVWTALREIQPKLHSILCALFLKDKTYANKPETIDALKDNIREAIGQPRQPFE